MTLVFGEEKRKEKKREEKKKMSWKFFINT
jgi:hypothetical protein